MPAGNDNSNAKHCCNDSCAGKPCKDLNCGLEATAVRDLAALYIRDALRADSWTVTVPPR